MDVITKSESVEFIKEKNAWSNYVMVSCLFSSVWITIPDLQFVKYEKFFLFFLVKYETQMSMPNKLKFCTFFKLCLFDQLIKYI